MKAKDLLRTAAIRIVLLSIIFVQAGPAFAQFLPPPRDPRIIVPNPEDFAEISAGAYTTCARKFNGYVYCWGLNDRGQAGVFTNGAPVVKPRQLFAFINGAWAPLIAAQIDLGFDHGCAKEPNGKVWCWGGSSYGQLGISTYGFLAEPVAVSGNFVFTSISAGQYSTCGTTAGGVLCWGAINNASSPALVRDWAGNPSTWNGFSKVTVGYLHACGLYVVGSWREVNCWGNNRFGQLAADPGVFPGPVPFALGSAFGSLVSAVVTQADFTCADQTSGFVQCVGYNGWGQLGNGQTSSSATFNPQTVGGGSLQLRGVSTGFNHACALDMSSRAYCWGNGYWGQFGNGQTHVSATPQAMSGGLTFRAISAGYLHTCGIGTDNRLYCTGSNTYGQGGFGYAGSWTWFPFATQNPS
jgi:alpha-tubulin suppressor-like RCC1 family protein